MEFIDENGGDPGLRVTKAAPKEELGRPGGPQGAREHEEKLKEGHSSNP